MAQYSVPNGDIPPQGGTTTTTAGGGTYYTESI